MKEKERSGLFLKRTNFSIIIFVLVISCSGNPPELLESWSQLNIINDPGKENPIQALSFFLHAKDEDGEGELDQIYLIHDEMQLVWSIPHEQWSTFTDQGNQWMGFNHLLGPGDGVFPEGDYRILLIDIGGERAESSFYVRNNIPIKEDLLLPVISHDIEKFSIQSDFPLFEVWFYDGEGQLIEKSRDFPMGDYLWNDIVRNISRRAASFTVYAEPESGSWGMISGPYYFNGS